MKSNQPPFSPPTVTKPQAIRHTLRAITVEDKNQKVKGAAWSERTILVAYGGYCQMMSTYKYIQALVAKWNSAVQRPGHDCRWLDVLHPIPCAEREALGSLGIYGH